MKQGISITVSNLGPVKGPCTVDLNNFMIFSGQSGLGKSYLAMLVHYVYRIIIGMDLTDFFDYKKIDYSELRDEHPDDTEAELFEISTAELCQWINLSAVEYLRRMTGNTELDPEIDIHFDDIPEKFTFCLYRTSIPKPHNEPAEVVEFIRLKENGDEMQMRVSISAIANIYFALMINNFFKRKYGISPSDHFFLPPSRGGILTVPSSSIFSSKDTMGMYLEFLSNFERIKTGYPVVLQPMSQTVKDILHERILQGEVDLDDNKSLVYKMKRRAGSPLPISAAASSVKELAPLALMVEKNVANQYSILFEEPESHLHPELQIAVVDLMAAMIVAGAHFQITTHSDYILRRVNDLIYLFMLRQKMGDERFSNYCKEEQVNGSVLLNPDLVNAYYLHADAEGNTLVTRQSLREGIPFDTFDEVLKTSILKSGDIYDTLFSLEDEDNHMNHENAD